MQTDPVLSRRLGGDGEAALRAVLMGQKVLEEAVSSEHRRPGTCFQERNSGAIPIQAPTGQARDEGVSLRGKVPELPTYNTVGKQHSPP